MAEAKGPTDFSGYWVLSKAEHLDDFLRALGFPWVVRKAAAKFATASVDIVTHAGAAVTVTSLNPKGSWTRVYDTARPVEQPNPEGVPCKTTAWWEGGVLRTRSEGSPLGPCESWRYRRGDTMVVKTAVRARPEDPEAACFWFFERLQSLQRHRGGASRAALLRALAADQGRVARATRRDNAYLQKVLLDWERWASPADEFIRVVVPGGAPYGPRPRPHGSTSRLRSRASPASSPLATPHSASATSLPALADGGGRGSSRLGGGRGSGAASPGPLGEAEPSLGPAVPPAVPLPRPAAATSGSEPGSGPAHARRLSSESVGTGGGGGSAAVAAATAAAAATVPRRALHYRSPSTESANLSQAALTPAASSPAAAPPPSAAEALMVFKLHEFLDARGIAAVVPVTSPNDTAEPQLLGMSPEQAEETAARLRELETDMLLGRQEAAVGCTCCGLVLSRESDRLPDYLRVWEMTLA